jgi:hypothetical protein
MKTVSGISTGKLLVVVAVIGVAALSLRAFAQSSPPASTSECDYKFVFRILKEHKLKDADTEKQFDAALTSFNGYGKTRVIYDINKHVGPGDIKSIKSDGACLRTDKVTVSAAAAKGGSVIAEGAHVTQTVTEESQGSDKASVHVTQYVASNQAEDIEKIVALLKN